MNNSINIPPQLQKEGIKFILLGNQDKNPIKGVSWKEQNFEYSETPLNEHLQDGNNYGVICGNGLIVIDADTPKLNELVNANLPPTFSVKTGKGVHYYFNCIGYDNKRVLKDNGIHLGEIQSTGTYVVGPNSIHPSGGVYTVLNDIPITFIDKGDVDNIFSKYYTSEKMNGDVILKGARSGLRNDSMFKLACSFREKGLGIEEVLTTIIGLNKNNKPPLSEAEIVSIVKSAFKYERKSQAELSVTKPLIQLPQQNRLVSDFATDLAEVFHDLDILFYKTEQKTVVEIRKLKHINEETKQIDEYLGFSEIEALRFVSLSERYITPFKKTKTDDGFKDIPVSMSPTYAGQVINSPQFEEGLKQIKRIFTAQIPILINGTLDLPSKGYDPRFRSWTPCDTIVIDQNVPIEEAKELIKEIFAEFCFEREQDRVMAVAGLLTPFLRGLYSSFNDRTPVFFYLANRERAGKDYCAGITGLVYEGVSIEENPISDGDSKGGHSEEFRKKITGVMAAGRKRYHSANNRGYISNAVLEGLITNKTYSDRVLGRNEIVTFDNELEISMSGNAGVTYTPDLANRCRFIRLKLAMEDPNQRTFNKPNLHLWVLQNRTKIISSLYALVREWYKAGQPSGKTPFTSFPEWARVCGGIMTYNGLGDPCLPDTEQVIGGDSETESMKQLYELFYERYKDQPLTKHRMMEIITEEGVQADGILHFLDLSKNSDKTRFGLLIQKYVDRILSNIIMVCVNKQITARHRQFIFTQYTKNYTDDTKVYTKTDVNVNLVNHVNVIDQTKQMSSVIGNRLEKGVMGVKVDVTPDQTGRKESSIQLRIQKALSEQVGFKIELEALKSIIIPFCVSDKEFEEVVSYGLKTGLWYMSKPGVIGLLE